MSARRKDFWKWVGGHQAFDNSSGEFIRTTRRLLEAAGNPEALMYSNSEETREQYKEFWAEWTKSLGYPAAPIVHAFKAAEPEYWEVDCPHCGEIHTHGASEGHRCSHCNRPKPPGAELGYWLLAT